MATDTRPCTPTDNLHNLSVVEPLSANPDQWRSTCNCADNDGNATVTCEAGTYEEACAGLAEHRGEPT